MAARALDMQDGHGAPEPLVVSIDIDQLVLF